MNISTTEIEQALNVLVATPRRLELLSKGLDHARLHFRSAEEPWSANDILAHLRACADIWGKSMIAMIDQDHPTMRYISPRTWIRKKDYPELEFRVSLEAFTKQRDDLIRILKLLRTEGWSRGATFTATTKGQEQTVLSYARRMAEHEIVHCIQIEGLLK